MLSIRLSFKIRYFIFFILAFLTLTRPFLVYAATTVVQPIGNLVQMWNPALVNTYLAKWDPNIIPGVTDPFDLRYQVSEIQPTKPMYFVRVFAEPNSGPLGSFIVRAATVRNLTKAQIRNILALPEPPRKIDIVKVPAGAKYGLWTGIAGRIMSPGHMWGQGGGEQIKIIGKETDPTPPADPPRFANYSRLPAASYMNAVEIGERALSYSQGIKSGNANKIAVYLESHLPAPYSDMEEVYTTLDFINTDGPPELMQALNQMTPLAYDTYSTTLFRNDLLFTNMIFARLQSLQFYNLVSCNDRDIVTWLDVSGEDARQGKEEDRLGFYYQTALIAGGIESQVSVTTKMGVGLGYLRNHLGWNSSGNANLNNGKLALYSSYNNSDYFFNTALLGGYHWGSANRNMDFTGLGFSVLTNLLVDSLTVNRTAHADTSGQTLSLYLNGGKNFYYNDLVFTPVAQVSYFYSTVASFDEYGAGDLNLHVQNFISETARTQLAIAISKLFNNNLTECIVGTLQFGWAHNFPLDDRSITASFDSLGGDFTINAYHQQTNEFLGSASIKTKISKRLFINGQYYVDLSHGFNSQSVSLNMSYYIDRL